NIRAFGGDPKRITIFGNNAGAASVHYHLLSPLTKRLFQRAIITSGAATAPWSFVPPDRATERTKEIAEALKCPQGNSEELAECLKKKDFRDVVRAAKEEMRDMFVPDSMGSLIGPTIEVKGDEDQHAFLTKHPYDVLKNASFRKVHLLAGVTKDEASDAAEALLHASEGQIEEDSVAKMTNDIRRICSRSNGTQPDASIAEEIKHFYMINNRRMPLEEKLQKYKELMADCLHHQHVSGAANFQRFHSVTHLFYFNVSGVPVETDSFLNLGLQKVLNFPFNFLHSLPRIFGVEALLGRGPTPSVNVLSHGVDLPFLFPIESVPKINKEHPMYNFSKSWVKFLVQFASRTSSKESLQFRNVSVTRLPLKGPMTYLEVSMEPKLISEPYETRLDFLKSSLQQLQKY
ncbi:unnamed protein product, partial [Allacma fusca]